MDDMDDMDMDMDMSSTCVPWGTILIGNHHTCLTRLYAMPRTIASVMAPVLFNPAVTARARFRL
jgi:hypothetical protein